MKEWFQMLPTSLLLEFWEMTTDRREPDVPAIRGFLMAEIERRVPERFNVWLSLPYPEDNHLRTVIEADYTCLDCERLCNGCGGLEPCYTSCAMKRSIKGV